MAKQKLVSVAEYALLCGNLSLQAIYNRETAGTLKFAKTKPVILIDILAYPPKRLSIGRPAYKSKI